MKPILPFLFAIPLFMAGSGLHAAEPVVAPDADESSEATDSLPKLDLTPKLLYQFLLAEIAGQRGQMGQSAMLYRELARETRDPRVARRATEMALHGRQLEVALESAQLWQSLEPESAPARQTLIRLLAALGRQADLAREVAALLAAEPQHIAQNLSHLNRLFARINDRKISRAIIETVTTPYHDLPEAHYARAIAAFEAQDIAAARQLIHRVLSLKPDWEAAALFQFQLAEDRVEGLTQLSTFIDRQPQAREAQLTYARALVAEKRYAEARRVFDRLLAQDAATPNGDVIFAVAVLSLQLNDTAAAEKQLQRLIEMGHAEADKARFYLGQIAEEGKRWDDAVRWFGTVGRGEHYLAARLHGANILAKQGNIEGARQHLTNSEAATPRERVQLLIGEAQILRDMGDVAAAYGVLVTGLTQQPDQHELMYEAALMAEKLGRHDEMETRLRRLIELKPDHAHAFNALGYSLAERNVRLPEARTLIDRALELAPNDPFILDSKGWVQFRMGDTDAALESLNRAFGIRPDPEIAAHLGEVLWSLGRQSEARTTWDKARREHPANEVLAETIKRLAP
ncbi:MAG: tetratricopeptide repeat protein [Rhodocyclaceae bacterium]|nr:tetratricopeptide repeat protein [Rhodocyclaceae bacterium]MDZ4214469.1 tetratricopeptide repeat protein [Rhodocyclaceae bacterium]